MIGVLEAVISAIADRGYINPDVLVSTDWVADHWANADPGVWGLRGPPRQPSVGGPARVSGCSSAW